MRWGLKVGDVAEVLPQLEEASFHGALSDPPYGLGFLGKAWDHAVPGPEVWAEVLRVLKPGAHLVAFGGTRTFHRLAVALEDAGFVLRDTLLWLRPKGFPKSRDLGDVPGFQGWGTGLKPAWEPALLAMRPVDGTFAANAARHGVAGLALDACRVAGPPWQKADRAAGAGFLSGKGFGRCGYGEPTRGMGTVQRSNPGGRWPANVLLSHADGCGVEGCAPECPVRALDEAAPAVGGGFGVCGDYASERSFGSAGMWAKSGRAGRVVGHGDAPAGASRFFYCAPASSSERDAGVTGRNEHPTVKPLGVCEWLARLICPPALGAPRRCLVPFSGSGSEMIGALFGGFDEVVGIEREPEHAAVARERLRHWIDGAAPLFAGELEEAAG